MGETMGGSGPANSIVVRRGRLVLIVLLTLAIIVPALQVASPIRALAASYSSTILADSPKAYYRLDDSGCCTAADSSGNGYSATYASSGITYSATGGISGDSDTAITTSYNGAAVTRSDSFLPSGSSARTLEAWEKTTTSGVFAIVSYGTAATNQYVAMNIGSGPTLSFDGYTNYVLKTAPYSLEDGNWHYLAATFDGTTAYLYIDGQQIGSGAVPLSTVASQGLWLGNAADGASAFPGSLDEVAIYPTALSATQISAHWRIGAANLACPATPTTGYAGTVAADHLPAWGGVRSRSDGLRQQQCLSPGRLYRRCKSCGTRCADRRCGRRDLGAIAGRAQCAWRARRAADGERCTKR